MSFGLQNLEFMVAPEWPPSLGVRNTHCLHTELCMVLFVQECCTGTRLYIKEHLATDSWTFQESLIDSQVISTCTVHVSKYCICYTLLTMQHCVAVAIGRPTEPKDAPAQQTFLELNVCDLLAKLHPHPHPTSHLIELGEQFMKKKESPKTF